MLYGLFRESPGCWSKAAASAVQMESKLTAQRPLRPLSRWRSSSLRNIKHITRKKGPQARLSDREVQMAFQTASGQT